MLENHPRYFEVFWGAQRAGLYTTPINWHLKAEEAGYIVEDCGATAIFTSAAHEGRGRRAGTVLRQRPRAPDDGRRDRRLRELRGRDRQATRPSRSPTRSRARSCSTPRARPAGPKGIKPAIDPQPFGAGGGAADHADPAHVRVLAGHRLPLPGAAVPRRAARLVDDRPAARRHGGRDGEVRPATLPRADRGAPGHPRPVRPDPLRADAEAVGRGARTHTTCPACRWSCTPPRRARSTSSGR